MSRPIIDIELDKKRPLRFGNAAIMAFCDRRDKSLAAISDMSPETMKPGDVIALLHAGLEDGARKRGEDFGLSVVDVADLLDDCDTQAVTETMFEHMQNSVSDKDTSDDESAGKSQ